MIVQVYMHIDNLQNKIKMIYLVYQSFILDLTATIVTTPERNFAWLDHLHGGPPSEAVVSSLSKVCSLVQEVAIKNQVPWGLTPSTF